MNRRALAHFNWPILLITLLLDVIGLVNLNSAVQVENAASLASVFPSQLLFVSVGIIGMLLMTALDYRIYERLAYPLYGVSLALLVATLVIGRSISGSQRWLDFGFFSVQPSELGKLVLVIVLAKYFHNDVRIGGYRLRDLWKPFLLLLPMLILIFMSPDLGTTAFYILLFLLIALSANLRWRSVALLVLIAIVTLPLVYGVALSDYQKDRIVTLFDPTHDPRGKGYQILQSRYAIGAGRLLGTGYEQGMQTHQGFIPENHNDFIMTVLAEEWGFVGCLLVLSLYYGLMMLGLKVANQSKERFGAILATGIVCTLFLQVVINLGAVLGLIPVTGVTLPLMSYGGSSILTVHLSIGLILNISMRRYMF